MKGAKNDFSMTFFIKDSDDRSKPVDKQVLFLKYVHNTDKAIIWLKSRHINWDYANIYIRRTREFKERIYNNEGQILNAKYFPIMAFDELGFLSALLTLFLCILWLIVSICKRQNDKYLNKIDRFINELADNKHRLINSIRLNGFPIARVIYMGTIDGINIFYHFDSYQFLPDFLPNEELMEDMKEVTQTFLQAKIPPRSFEEAIELISEYYKYFPDSEAHLYKDEFFNRLPYLLPSQ